MHDIGRLYRGLKLLDEAAPYLEESFSISPCYQNLKELIRLQLDFADVNSAFELIKLLLSLDLENPTVFNDSIHFANEGNFTGTLFEYLKSLADDQERDSLPKANCLYYAGQILLRRDTKQAKKYLCAARKIFCKLFPSKHAVFKAIQFSIKQCDSSETLNK